MLWGAVCGDSIMYVHLGASLREANYAHVGNIFAHFIFAA